MGLAIGAWRVLMAIKDGFVLVFMLLFFGLIYLVLSAGGNAGAVHDGALVLDLRGSIVEQAAQTDEQDVLSGRSVPREFQVRDLVRALDAAANDDRVKAVVLNLSGFTGGGQVALERVGAALDQVRSAKKPILAYSSGYDDQTYLLSSHATEIWLDPMGMAVFPGPGGARLYYKGLIDKLGANVHVYRVGKYKSFVEPYTRADQSPEARQANTALLQAISNDWIDYVHAARPEAKLHDYIVGLQAKTDANGGDLAKTALASKIVDKLGDDYAFAARVADIVGPGDGRRLGGYRTIKLADWLAANPASTSGDAIGVVTVAGEIIDGKSTGSQAGGDTVAHLIENAVADDNVKALVLRIDSPGGSVAASEKIRLALMQAKSKGLPIIASMGSVAASGGYWISTPASKVLAEPGTITGSIGVFGIIPTFERSLAKLGITHDGEATTPLAGQPDIFSGTTPQLDALIQTSINATYQRFLGLVAEARKLPVAHVDEIAQGRVWGGKDAKENKLIDGYGTLDDAIVEAAKAAKLDPADVHPQFIVKEPNWLVALFSGLNAPDDTDVLDPMSRLARGQTRSMRLALDDVQSLLREPVVQVRCFECPMPSSEQSRTSELSRMLERMVGL
jgi:protease-4